MNALRIIAASVLCIICSIACVPARAFSLPVPTSSTAQQAGPQSALFSTAPVVLDGVPLFQVASPTHVVPGQLSANDRAILVDTALQQMVATTSQGPEYDWRTLRVFMHPHHAFITIEAIDARHSAPVTIVTVTSADARYQGSSIDDVAASWQVILQRKLVDALAKREPAVQRRNIEVVARAALGLAFGTAVLFLAWAMLRRRIRMLVEEFTHCEEARSNDAEQHGVEGLGHGVTRHQARELRRHHALQRLRLLSGASGAIVWMGVLSWFVVATWALALFSQTIALSMSLSSRLTAIGVIWISAGMLNRVCDALIARTAAAWTHRHFLSAEERTRTLLRVPTVASAVSQFKTIFVVLLAIVFTLGQFGLPIGSVLTISGISALGVTLALQGLLRDLIQGLLVLCEDQYAIGDFVTINGNTGLVEQLTLRIVMIRDRTGCVVTIPHGAVNAVQNYSRLWSRIDYQVSISPDADPDAAIAAIRATLEELAKDPSSHGSLLLPVEWIGVDAFTKDWTLIRASVRTGPLQQFTLRRQINDLVRRRLAEAGIAYGPQIEAQYIPLS